MKHIDKEFIDFLKENEIYDVFINNLIELRYTSVDLHTYLDSTIPLGYIAGAFTWSDSSEGHNYWETLGDKWWKFINKDRKEEADGVTDSEGKST